MAKRAVASHGQEQVLDKSLCGSEQTNKLHLEVPASEAKMYERCGTNLEAESKAIITAVAALTSLSGEKLKGRVKATPFPQKLMNVLASEQYSKAIAWLDHGQAFEIKDSKRLVIEVLPQCFKQAKYSSFIRKLHRWGFQRKSRGPETGAFFHELFQRNRTHLCQQMTMGASTRTKNGGNDCSWKNVLPDSAWQPEATRTNSCKRQSQNGPSTFPALQVNVDNMPNVNSDSSSPLLKSETSLHDKREFASLSQQYECIADKQLPEELDLPFPTPAKRQRSNQDRPAMEGKRESIKLKSQQFLSSHSEYHSPDVVVDDPLMALATSREGIGSTEDIIREYSAPSSSAAYDSLRDRILRQFESANRDRILRSLCSFSDVQYQPLFPPRTRLPLPKIYILEHFDALGGADNWKRQMLPSMNQNIPQIFLNTNIPRDLASLPQRAQVTQEQNILNTLPSPPSPPCPNNETFHFSNSGLQELLISRRATNDIGQHENT